MCNEEVDVWWAEQSVRTGGVASIYYITDRKYTIYPDTILHQVAGAVTKLLPGKEIYISSYDNTMSHFIVRTYADVSPEISTSTREVTVSWIICLR